MGEVSCALGVGYGVGSGKSIAILDDNTVLNYYLG